MTLASGLALALPASAGAAETSRDTTSAAEHVQSDVTAAADNWRFRVDGTRIFSLPDANSAVRGLAYFNQSATHHGYFPGNQSPTYTCDNGVTTNLWADVTNNATGVRGWVPTCNLVRPPAPTN